MDFNSGPYELKVPMIKWLQVGKPVSKHELHLESQFTFPLFSLKVTLLKKIKDVSIKGNGI